MEIGGCEGAAVRDGRVEKVLHPPYSGGSGKGRPWGKLLRNGADMGPRAGCGEVRDGTCRGKEGGDVGRVQKGGNKDEAVMLERCEKGGWRGGRWAQRLRERSGRKG